MANDGKKYYLDANLAQNLCTELLVKAGARENDAALVAQNLVLADLRGIGSHGISRMDAYCERVSGGLINPEPDIKVLSESASTVLLDADNALGAVAGVRAMDMCIEKARESGMASCAVRNSNHFGIAAFYAMRALPRDMIGITLSSAAPTMSPWGGISPMIGTNPFCYAVPAGKYRPIVLDCATSVVARGKITLAQIEGQSIPEGWAMDATGRPTTDPSAALKGSVLPFGMYKGSGISMMVDIFCAMLGGANFGPHIGELYNNPDSRQGLGHFFCAIDISRFAEPEFFKNRIDGMISELKSGQKAEGVEEIFVPGEIEFDNEIYNRKHGIEAGQGVMGDLDKLCVRYGVSMRPIDCVKPA